MTVLFISLAGGSGALARFIVDGLVRTRLGRRFPWGTMLINISGSLILGIITGLFLNHKVGMNTKLILGTGFCGGYTTFSTASFESVRLIEEKLYSQAFYQIMGSLVFSVAFAGLGIWIGMLF
ncbi:MAG TPA: fluoride efflux transporter CrcB [Candidatus Saccharimonadales bacterium]|nr:fluoride efflux transporter CrcB [Candidatus Saccharimonadales bacterium]